jgi:ABC-type ATPase involved in cell division
MPNDQSPLGIEARGLTKTFGRLAAVRDLNLQVAPGTLFGFLGPNGSGKSTTIKLLTGLLAPTAGEVRVAGQTVSLENIELRRVIGILPEDAALFHSLTIWEHLELSGPLYGLSRQDTRARAIQLLRHLDLERDSGTYIDEASYGMRKKCALAMALLHNPRILLILRYQWRAYWRRFIRTGHRAQFYLLMLAVLGWLFFVRLPPRLSRAAHELGSRTDDLDGCGALGLVCAVAVRPRRRRGRQPDQPSSAHISDRRRRRSTASWQTGCPRRSPIPPHGRRAGVAGIDAAVRRGTC